MKINVIYTGPRPGSARINTIKDLRAKYNFSLPEAKKATSGMRETIKVEDLEEFKLIFADEFKVLPDIDLVELSTKLYEYASELPLNDPNRWLVDFASELLEATHFSHDEKDPEELITKRLEEWLMCHQMEVEDAGAGE